jgi:hypothetical protein
MPLVVTVRATYSGSTALVPTAVTVTGLVGAETMVPTAVVAQHADVASNGSNFMTAITASTGTANFNNYSITVANSPVTIDRKLVTLSGALTASKTYDGNVSASILTAGVTPNVVYGSDAVTVSAITGTYDSPNVSTTRVVTATGVTLTGADANNYVWDNGDPIDYTNWYPGKPDHYNPDEFCVIQSSSLQWDDYPCGHVRPFACEIPSPRKCTAGKYYQLLFLPKEKLKQHERTKWHIQFKKAVA